MRSPYLHFCFLVALFFMPLLCGAAVRPFVWDWRGGDDTFASVWPHMRCPYLHLCFLVALHAMPLLCGAAVRPFVWDWRGGDRRLWSGSWLVERVCRTRSSSTRSYSTCGVNTVGQERACFLFQARSVT